MGVTSIYIGGIDRTNVVAMGGYNISQRANAPSTSVIRLIGKDSAYFPVEGERIRIFDGTETFYSGYIDRITRTLDKNELASGAWRSSVETQDEMKLLSQHIVGERSWTNENAGEVIRQIVIADLNLNGIDYANVEDGPVLSYVSFVYETALEAFKRIAEETGYTFWLDYDRKLYYRPKNFVTSSFVANGYTVESSSITRDQSSYYNSYLCRVAEALRPSAVETITATAAQYTFELAYACAAAPSIRLNGVDQSVDLVGVGGSAFYWTQDSKTIIRDDTQPPLIAGDEVEVTYVGLENTYFGAQDLGEIATRAAIEGGSGLHKLFEDVNGRISFQQGQAWADLRLSELKQTSRSVSVVTHKGYTSDAESVKVGEQITVDLPDLPASGLWLVDGIDYERLRVHDDAPFRHKVTINAVQGGPKTSAADFFRGLQTGTSSRSLGGVVTGGGIGGGGTLPHVLTNGDGSYTPNLSAFSGFTIVLNGVDCDIETATGGTSGQMFAIGIKQDAAGSRGVTWAATYRGVEGIDIDGTANLVSTFLFQLRADGNSYLVAAPRIGAIY